MILALLAATVLMADVVSAPQPTATPPAAGVQPTAKVDRRVNKLGLICRNEAVLGSRFPKKVCFTPEALAERTREDRANLELDQVGHK